MYAWIVEKVSPILYTYLEESKQNGSIRIDCYDDLISISLIIRMDDKLIACQEHRIKDFELAIIQSDYQDIFSNSVGHIIIQGIKRTLELQKAYKVKDLRCQDAE